MNRTLHAFSILLGVSLLLAACGGTAPPDADVQTPTPTTVQEQADGGETGGGDAVEEPQDGPTPTLVPTLVPTSTATTVPQSLQGSSPYGPELEQFPAGISPLTGLPVEDPAMLKLPAVLISITNFPPSARPQAGLSSSPWIWEIYIGEGMTRFLVTFYGEEPAVEATVLGSCPVRAGVITRDGSPLLGNRAWLDGNANGTQDAREPGIAGLCVTLYDTAGGVLQESSTDSNGYYGFNVEPGGYVVGFELLDGYQITQQDAGYDDTDSDPDPASGLTAAVNLTADDLTRDAGYIPEVEPSATDTPDPARPTPTPPSGLVTTYVPAQVGPIRSMRTAYENIRTFFPGGCLVAASGYSGVLAEVKGCKMVYGSDEGNINSAMLDITRIRELAQANVDPTHPINYSGNLFDETPPAGGSPAQELRVFYSWQNQALWIYDALAGAYQRNDNYPGAEETFVPETDRLTGRQLLFENVIIMIVPHSARAESWIDINLVPGEMGKAYLFRDGQMFPIYWSTLAGEYEQTSQMLRPVKFVDAQRNPVALAPGHTWVSIMTPASTVKEESAGNWLARFYAPAIP